MPLSHSQARPRQLGVQGLASPSCQILGLLVSSQAVNRAHSLWAGVGWPQDVTVPMSPSPEAVPPGLCPAHGFRTPARKERSKMMGKRVLFHQTALALLLRSPEQAPSQPALLKSPLGPRSAPGPCPQPPALSSRRRRALPSYCGWSRVPGGAGMAAGGPAVPGCSPGCLDALPASLSRWGKAAAVPGHPAPSPCLGAN